MKCLLKNAVVLAICLSVASCTSMRVVAEGRNAVDTVARDATQGLHAGETLLVHTREGQPREILYERTEGSELVGKAEGAEMRIEIGKVVRIERKETDGWKTAGLVGSVVAVLTAVGLAAGRDAANALAGPYERKGSK